MPETGQVAVTDVETADRPDPADPSSPAGISDPAGLPDLVRVVLAPGTAGEPFDRYRRLRTLAPVHRSEEFRATVLSRFEDCQRVLADRDTFPVVDAQWMQKYIPGWTADRVPEEFFSSLFFRNPPDHTQLRARLSRGFTTRRLERLRPVVAEQVRHAFDELRQRGSASDVVDFQEVVSVPLALAVLGDLLGVPAADQARCWDLLLTAVPPPSPQADPAEQQASRQRAAAASAQVGEYFTTLVEQRREAPADDFISACLADDDSTAESWTSRQLALALLPVFGSGVGTLSDTMGNAVYTLLSRPEDLARLAADPELAASGAAEIARYCGAYHVTRRYASREIDIGGVTVPEGSAVVLLLAAANRDGDRFTDPDDFDPQRNAAGSLGFGGGIHHCLGAALAKVVLEELCRAASGLGALRLAGTPQWRPSMLFFGPVTLPVRWVDETSGHASDQASMRADQESIR